LSRSRNYVLKCTIRAPHVTSATASILGKIGIWADWGGDCSFSQTGDFIGDGGNGTHISTSATDGRMVQFSKVFTVPSSASQILLRLRVRLFGNSTTAVVSSDQCNIPQTTSLRVGETEDYVINLSSVPLRIGLNGDLEEELNVSDPLSLTIFPNPTGEGQNTIFSLVGITDPQTCITVIDALGRGVYTKTLGDACLNGKVEIGGQFPKGYYLVRIVSKESQLIDRFIVQ
jgi:hypothetical protein